jgi:hypothetical protein
MTTARLTQQAAETLLEGAPAARLTQQVGEVLLIGRPLARATFQAIEALHSTAMATPPTSSRRPVMIVCVAA